MNIDREISRGVTVSLEDMLDARERRAARQREFLSKGEGSLLSFTLNIPGAVKTYPLTEMAFAAGCQAVRSSLVRTGAGILAWEAETRPTGSELLALVSLPATRLKETGMDVEARHPLGRLFDIDVIGPDGVPVRGVDNGRAVRRCVVCGGPVWECARSRRHPAEELSRRTAEILYRHFSHKHADLVASAATRALLYEVGCTPKPGLVDRNNSGSHDDMDIFTFFDSVAALTPYFREMALAGIEYEGELECFLPELRYAGMCAETTMFHATGGINTHKGAIFSLGLLAAAAGLSWSGRVPGDPHGLLEACKRMAARTPEEFKASADSAGKKRTHGEEVYHQYGVRGARGEAAAGYPSVLQCGLPAMDDGLAAGMSLNDAGVVAFMHLLAIVEDSNIVSRSDAGTLRALQEELRETIASSPDPYRLVGTASDLDPVFIRKNLSPGGCADLLAMCYFLVFSREIFDRY